MLRKIVVILTMLLCSMATQLYALGLGTVTVESSLNQPLRMRIELLQLGDTRLQDVRVSIASGADFERFNIERASFLSNIRFSVESSGQGNVIILTSLQIVREPYLSFIIDTRWPNGRLLSEHTILLDLPVFEDQQSTSEIRQPISPILQSPTRAQATDAEPFVESSSAPAVSAPSSTNSAANLQPEILSPEPDVEENVADADVVEPSQSETEEPAAEQDVEEQAVEEQVVEEEPVDVEEELAEEVAQAEPDVIEAAADLVEPEPEVVEPETIETGANDTLSDIAQEVRPNTNVSMQQTMLALQELNPEAFADGNINRLRSGQILRVPTFAEIQSIDPLAAVDEVTRQNQEFAEVDVQPLAAPSVAAPEQDAQPQGQLSVVSSEDAIDASSGAAQLADAENEALDQRISELEAQLAQRQEEADRAAIEREELDSRMVDLESQIVAAQEIIRLQDMQLAQLQESLSAAAADAQILAEQQSIQAAAEAEAAQPVDSPTSLFDDLMRILTGNSLFILFGIVLVILLLVVLMLRRNRAAKIDEHDIDEIAGQDFDSDAEEASLKDSEKGAASAEFQDYDPADLDDELDDIIGVSDEAESANEVDEAEEAPQLDVLTIVEQLVGEQQYRRALSMLNTSLKEQGDSEDVRAKVSEVEGLLEAEEIEQRKIDEAAQAEETANRESETKSFLDDLGIDLDTFDYDDDTADSEAEDEPTAAAEIEEVSVESEDVDMMFDLGGDDASTSNVGELSVDEDAAEEVESFEFDLEDDSNLVESKASDPEDIDIDTLEFDADAIKEVSANSDVDEDDDEEVDLETFSFDPTAAASVTETVETKEEEAASEEDSNAIEFSFDMDDVDDGAESQEPVRNEEIETFDFDLDDDAGDTVLETPDTKVSSTTEDEGDDFDFDLDEFEIEPVKEKSVTNDSAADDDFLDLDVETAQVETAETAIDEIEFDIDTDEEPEESITSSDISDDDSISDDDLEFLTDDEVEIESVDDVEEVDMLSDDEEAATKLELAYAYQKMGDMVGAKEILQEVIKEGSSEQVEEASKLLGKLDGKSS